jgi:hypothetical protein
MTVRIKKIITSGILQGIEVEEEYFSTLKDSRKIGKEYKGYTHNYVIISIKYK